MTNIYGWKRRLLTRRYASLPNNYLDTSVTSALDTLQTKINISLNKNQVHPQGPQKLSS